MKKLLTAIAAARSSNKKNSISIGYENFQKIVADVQ